jgi:hypothetical protein
VLGFTAAAASTMFALRMSILPSNALRGIRSCGESCARAPMLSEMPIAAAIVPLEMLRSFEFIQLN